VQKPTLAGRKTKKVPRANSAEPKVTFHEGDG